MECSVTAIGGYHSHLNDTSSSFHLVVSND